MVGVCVYVFVRQGEFRTAVRTTGCVQTTDYMGTTDFVWTSDFVNRVLYAQFGGASLTAEYCESNP